MDAMRELWAFMRVRKKFWLAPIIIVLLLLGTLFYLAGQTTIGGLIYMGI
ncbi:MAG TPA: DUF5989 family protein [Candidatus Hydrogenedentes bacterium]|nr:DUF5989 family protein [Candidatus Hydrogenedentota bacterium]